MNQDYPELQQFLAGYFNQDWVDDHKSADDVINYFISDSSEETKTIVQRELERLISTEKTEKELEDFLFSRWVATTIISTNGTMAEHG